MLLHLPTTTSTMDVAKSLIESGDTTTTMVLADEQTAARGRHNRPWTTFGPHSLMCTWIFRPATGPHLPLVVALALHEAIAHLISQSPTPNTQSPKPIAHSPSPIAHLQIKWPNDLLLNGKKLAGILCENIGQTASLVGIGLNITQPDEVPENFTGTFLNPPETLTPETLTSLINTCLQRQVALYQSQGWSQTLHNSYLQHCATLGKTVHWRRNTEGPQGAVTHVLTGLVRGLTPSGHLELVAEDGTEHVIHSGEIFDKR